MRKTKINLLPTKISLLQFKKWLKKNVGKKCKLFEPDCFTCQAWLLYEQVELFVKRIERLDK